MTMIHKDKASSVPTMPDNVKALPEYINLDKWEENGYVWSGTIVPKNLQRLDNMIPVSYQNKPIDLKCTLINENQVLTLSMDFSGEIWVICQRCLQPLAIDITHESQLIILKNEEQMGLIEDADDYLLIEELIPHKAEDKKADRLLPLTKLVEDELLLDVPLSAKHEDCEMAVQQVGEIIEVENENPFAVLESLKGKL